MTTNISTLKEATHGQWVADVLKFDKSLAAEVEVYGIQPELILTTEMQKRLGFLQYQTAVTKGVADLKRVVYERKQKETATEISGILAGMRDVYGTAQPVRFAILKKDGRHVEISSFDPQLPMEGRKVEVPIPSQVTIAADYDEEYNSYNAVSLVSHEPISRETFMTALYAVARTPKEIYAEDKGSVAVVRGKIQYVGPAPRWKNKTIDGEESVWQLNQRRDPRGHPVLRFKLFEEEMQTGGMVVPISVSATVAHMKNVVPIVEIQDLAGMCQYAVSEDDDPRTQARMVQDIVQGREVLIVGRVSGYEPRPDKTFVNLDVHTIYQIGDSQKTLPGPDPALAPEPEPEPEPGIEPEPAPESKPTSDSIPETSPAAKVLTYLEAVVMVAGIKPEDINGQEVWEEKFKDAMSYDIFDTILTQFKAGKK